MKALFTVAICLGLMHWPLARQLFDKGEIRANCFIR